MFCTGALPQTSLNPWQAVVNSQDVMALMNGQDTWNLSWETSPMNHSIPGAFFGHLPQLIRGWMMASGDLLIVWGLCAINRGSGR